MLRAEATIEQVYLYRHPVDMRKQRNGLAALVQEVMQPTRSRAPSSCSPASAGCRIFLIDELFSGTNTIERVAAAKAVLDALSINAQVLVTTHNVELQQLLSDRFERYHFREDPSVEGFFDYKLHRGASHERNAIRLLERMGFPPRIIQEAPALAEGQAASSRKPRSH